MNCIEQGRFVIVVTLSVSILSLHLLTHPFIQILPLNFDHSHPSQSLITPPYADTKKRRPVRIFNVRKRGEKGGKHSYTIEVE